jgi:predicted permease
MLALRSLTRTPGFYGLALATLGLGVAAATVMFSITESVLWRPYTFSDPEKLVWLTEFNPKLDPLGNPVSAPKFREWRERARSFENLAAMTYGESHSLTGSAERVRSNTVSAGFFETLRVHPAFGREFSAADERSVDSRPIVLADAFWRRRFGSAADVLGQKVTLDGDPYTVVGVLPAGFRLEFLPDIAEPDFFLPLHSADPALKRTQRRLVVVGRLHSGTTAAQAGVEMAALSGQLAVQHPEDADWTVNVENLRVRATQSESRSLFLYMGFATLVLLIACANVAGLQLVRFTGRQREYALRLALGASRMALLRHALAENVWVALPGGALGALLASWGVSGVRALLPPNQISRATDITMDPTALAFVLLVSIGAALVCALAPAILARRVDLDLTLRSGTRGGSGDRGMRRRMNILIGAEVSLAFVLLFAAGLFVSSHARLRNVGLGFEPRDLLTMRIVPAGTQSTPDARRRFFGRLFQKAHDLPGVERAALAGGLPLDYPAGVALAWSGAELRPQPLARVVTPDYFRVLEIPLLHGRAFTDADAENAPRVAIINENLANTLFPGENPVGRRLTVVLGGDSAIPAGSVEVVGLARNSKELGLDEVPFGDVYLPFAQNPMRSMYLLLKTKGSAGSVAPILRQELRGLDSDGVLYNVATMEERLRDSLRGEQFHLTLVSLFAALAVLLAAVGVYGAVSFSTAQRTKEYALRVALGAMPRAILNLMLMHTIRIALAGVACGLGAALVLGRLLKSALYMAPHLHPGLIYGVGITDPVSLAGAACLLLGVAAIAGLPPAARACRVDPCEALRQE